MTTGKDIDTQVAHERERYRWALGEFVMVWADVEAELYEALKYYAGVSDGVARAIFSGTRASGMVADLKGIIHNTKIEAKRKKDLEYVLPQIVSINTIRDRIFHFSSSLAMGIKSGDPTTQYIDNTVRVSRYGNEFIEEVNSDLLLKINPDCYAIHGYLNQHRFRGDEPFLSYGEMKGSLPTWLYKPAQPNKKKEKYAAARPKRQRQR